MATSTNYGWAEPDNTSLVKDGAQAMRTLGNAIDTSLWNSGYGQAGKNKVINGDFNVWQRGTSFSYGGAYTFSADRWQGYGYSGAQTVTQQTFTPGAAPVAGYEGQYFMRVSCNNTTNYFLTRVEDVRTLAGQTATLSFWMKSASAQTLAAVGVVQNFGSGGSGSVTVLNNSSTAVTTSWVRYSFTFSMPSVSGKTIGTSSYLQIDLQGAINNAIDMWGVQLEYGSTATPFQTASGGSIQNELAMCQRYYQQGNYGWAGTGATSTAVSLFGNFPTMRTAPSVGLTAALKITDAVATDYTQSSSNISIVNGTRVTTSSIFVQPPNFTGLTAYRPYFTMPNEGGQIQLSAEL